MTGGEAKAAQSAAKTRVRLPEVITETGRIAREFAAARVISSPLPAQSLMQRPSRSRLRAAHQQATIGLRLAQNGQLTQAIGRFEVSIDLDPTVAEVHHDLGLARLKLARMEEAADALRAAIRLKPTFLTAHLNLGTALDHLGRIGEALAAYQTAVGLDPGQHGAHARLGQIHLTEGRRTQAEAAFRAAAVAAAQIGSLRAQLYEALAERTAGRATQAELLLRTIISNNPKFGEAHVALGQILAERGEADEAATCLETGVTLDPNMAAAWYHLATNRKFSDADQGLVARMNACLTQPDLVPWQRQSLHFAIGKANDDMHDYSAAMRHFDAANLIRGARHRLDRTALARQTDHVIASAPKGYRDLCPEVGLDDATPILIVGMPRSGTTLVEQIVSSHPNVVAGGELGFWRERNRAGLGIFGAPEAEAARRVAIDYVKVLRSISTDAARITDKMPFNFAHLGIIHQLFPRAAILHCRRNPIDTCLSIFSTNFEAAFDFASDRSSLVFFYREYQRLMAHWRAVLPADRFIELDYEVLVNDPEPVTRRLIATCGLEWNEACLTPHRNQRNIATASLWQARQPIYRTSVERWRRYEPWLGELCALLPQSEISSARSGGG